MGIAKSDLLALADQRLAEARQLLRTGFPGGAYYLGGYAIECGLKPVIASVYVNQSFPDDLKRWSMLKLHDPEKLLDICRDLKPGLTTSMDTNLNLQKNWDVVIAWTPTKRYLPRIALTDAEDLLNAIDDGHAGILPWLKTFC